LKLLAFFCFFFFLSGSSSCGGFVSPLLGGFFSVFPPDKNFVGDGHESFFGSRPGIKAWTKGFFLTGFFSFNLRCWAAGLFVVIITSPPAFPFFLILVFCEIPSATRARAFGLLPTAKSQEKISCLSPSASLLVTLNPFLPPVRASDLATPTVSTAVTFLLDFQFALLSPAVFFFFSPREANTTYSNASLPPSPPPGVGPPPPPRGPPPPPPSRPFFAPGFFLNC